MSKVQIVERKLDFVIRNEETRVLSQKKHSLVVAKSVAVAGGEPIYNMAWQCLPLGSIFSLSWRPIYGLNWTNIKPDPNTQLTLCGSWQETRINSVWDLRSDGYWTISDSAKTKDHIGIGNIEYDRHPESSSRGIYVVVGIKMSDTWTPIFVDPTKLKMGSSTAYRPGENVKWWFQSGCTTGTVVTVEKVTGSFDFTKTTYTCSTYGPDGWKNGTQRPSEEPIRRSRGTPPITSWPFVSRIIFGTGKIDEIVSHVEEELSGEYTKVDANTTGSVLTVSVWKDTFVFSNGQPICVGDVVADVSASIRSARVEGVLSRGISWWFDDNIGQLAHPEIFNFLHQNEKKYVESIENRKLYATHYNFGQAVGGSEKDAMTFIDCEHLKKESSPAAWPRRLEVRMVSWDKEKVIDRISLSYDKFSLTHGPGKRSEIETLVLDLGPGEKINKVRMRRSGKAWGADGVSFFEVETTKGQRKSVGVAGPANEIVECRLPAGFEGLKGFYGWSGEIVDRLGLIWGRA